MISLASIRQGGAVLPPRVLLYGTHGVGKTSFAASAPSPVFLQTEDGLGTLDAPTFGMLRSYDDVMEAIGALYNEDHQFQTVVLDSLDWLEPLVWAQVAKANGWANVESPGYGKGYAAAIDAWRVLLEGLNALRDDKGMAVIGIAHSEIKRFDSPDNEPYDRYVIKLHAKSSALLQEHVDAVLFANYRISTVKSDVGFNKKVVRGVGGSDRLLYTIERPAFLAKNRFGMPESIPLDWDSFAQHVPFYANTQQKAA